MGSSDLTILDLYIPTIIIIGFISTAISSLPRSIARDREIGWLRRVSTTPVHPSRLLAAQLILNLSYSLVATLVVIFGGETIFGASLNVNVPFFVLSIVLAVAVIFSLGLVVTAITPSQSLELPLPLLRYRYRSEGSLVRHAIFVGNFLPVSFTGGMLPTSPLLVISLTSLV